MQKNLITLKDNHQWIDITTPSKEGLEQLATEYNVPIRLLLNTLDPEHLPRYETLGHSSFIVIRVMDPKTKIHADCIEELTTKIALLISEKFTICIHRLELGFLNQIKELALSADEKISQKEVIRRIMIGAIDTFNHPLDELEKKSDLFEEYIFKKTHTSQIVKEGYFLKRRASAFRKILKFTNEILLKLTGRPDFEWSDFENIKSSLDRMLFYTDEVIESVTGLLNLHVALSSQKTNEASYKTNEIMRVLTIFSIFFLPLNFIAGIYGMNFKYMPELEWEFGYFLIVGIMATLAALIFYWVLSRGWLKKNDDL